MRLLGLLLLTSAAFAATAKPAAPNRVQLKDGWQLQSSCKLTDAKGEVISSPKFSPKGWLRTTVPHTVLGAQVDGEVFKDLPKGDPFYGMNLRQIPGTDYPIKKLYNNMPMTEDSPYRCSWWYRTEFHVPAASAGKHLWLRFEGINYRANIWLNGKQLASSDDVAGAYRTYEFPLANLNRGVNTLAVETFAQTETDLGINFVDWNPTPADKSMGLWRPVYLEGSRDVAVRAPAVFTHLADADLKQAELTGTFEVVNATDHEVIGTAVLDLGKLGKLQQPVTLAPQEKKTVNFGPLPVTDPQLWWPYQMGPPALQAAEARFLIGKNVTDAKQFRFGIREITGEKNAQGNLQLKVNGRRLLVRGGGWAPDIFLRSDPKRLEDEFRYVRHMGLNTIRLEGKMEVERFYDLADELGVLVMAGWCCCDHWEHWQKWTEADHKISQASLVSQMEKLRAHPSMLIWLNGSDGPPPADVEADYIRILKEMQWPNPYISSAAATHAEGIGPSGVKMTGPYDYVQPAYWLTDPGKYGGAWGFNTETSPGPAIPPKSSLAKFLPPEHLWPIDEVWNYHAGISRFAQINIFRDALTQTYGEPQSLDDFERKSQAMAYEGERAMFEAYRRNQPQSTGVIQWMLNNAWPSTIWHLYDYYLQPAGGYFGTRKANEPLHVQYSYDDRSIVLVNETTTPYSGLDLHVRVFDAQSKQVLDKHIESAVTADGVSRAFTLPPFEDQSPLYFVQLDVSFPHGQPLSSNFYWLPQQAGALDWAKTNGFYTPAAPYPDLKALEQLPPTNVSYSVSWRRDGAWQVATVKLKNTGASIAVLTTLRLVRGGDDVRPALFDDNYFALLPSEERSVEVRYQGAPGAHVEVSGWNLAARAKHTAQSPKR